MVPIENEQSADMKSVVCVSTQTTIQNGGRDHYYIEEFTYFTLSAK